MSSQAFIAAESALYHVAEICDALSLPVSSYYADKKAVPSKRKLRDTALAPAVTRAFFDSGKTYGAVRIKAELEDGGDVVCRHRIARVMKQKGFDARPKRKHRVCTTDSNHNLGYARNLVARDFTTNAPNEVWVADVTYLPSVQGWSYLCAVTDLFSRRVVGFAVATHKRDELSVAAIKQAFALRNPPENLIVHSDRGSEFASHAFRGVLTDHKAMQSMSRKADCYDNAVAESFFASLEKDILMRNHFQTKQQAMRAAARYITNFYNPKRRHSYNGQISPVRAEQNYALTMRVLTA